MGNEGLKENIEVIAGLRVCWGSGFRVVVLLL